MATKTIPGNGQDTSALATVATSNGPTRLDLRLAWARETLGVTPAATQTEVRRAFLVGMPTDSFVPTEAWQQAYLTLAQEIGNISEFPDPPCFVRDEEERLREEVEQFAYRYFSLPVDIRQRALDDILCRCPRDCQVRARLESLSLGVSIDPNVKSTEESRALVGFLIELYTLPPIERAMRRTAIFEVLKPNLEAWEAAAHVLRSEHPKISALDPLLMDKLKLLGRVFETPFRGDHWSHHSVTNVEQRDGGRPVPATLLATERGETQQKRRWANLLPLWPLLFFGFIVVLAGVKFAGKIEKSSRYVAPRSTIPLRERSNKRNSPVGEKPVERTEDTSGRPSSSPDKISGVGEAQGEDPVALRVRRQEEEFQKLLLELRERERRRWPNR